MLDAPRAPAGADAPSAEACGALRWVAAFGDPWRWRAELGSLDWSSAANDALARFEGIEVAARTAARWTPDLDADLAAIANGAAAESAAIRTASSWLELAETGDGDQAGPLEAVHEAAAARCDIVAPDGFVVGQRVDAHLLDENADLGIDPVVDGGEPFLSDLTQVVRAADPDLAGVQVVSAEGADVVLIELQRDGQPFGWGIAGYSFSPEIPTAPGEEMATGYVLERWEPSREALCSSIAAEGRMVTEDCGVGSG